MLQCLRDRWGTPDAAKARRLARHEGTGGAGRMTVRAGATAFGHLLKRQRQAAGLTQEALAARASLSVRAVSDLERGINHRPHADTLRLLAEALCLSAADQTAFTVTARGQGEVSFALLSGRSPSLTPPTGDLPPFVGQEEALAVLRHHLRGGRPPLLLVAGAAGSGKSRLLWETAQGAVGLGFRVLEGACHRSGREPYAPLLAALASYIHAQPSTQLRVDLRECAWLARLLPELADLLTESRALPAVSPEQERRLMFEAAARFLAHIAGPAGTLLVLDDLQWAGADALELLAALVRSASRSLYLVAAYRTTEMPEQAPIEALLADLVADGLATTASLEPPGACTPAARAPSSSSLPVPTSPLIGRADDLAAVAHRLLDEDTRLLTLTGPGGVGKTHLALHVAADLVHEYAGSLFFVALAPLCDPALVAGVIAHTVGMRERGERPIAESLMMHLREQRVLLLLDNFEHLLPAAPLVAELVASCPRLRVLVTSRAALHLREEREYPVAPLAVPDLAHLPSVDALTQYPAINLFVRRATAVKPEFRVTYSNAPAVAEICTRLDGLPLAIELAAARIKLLPAHALLARLAGPYGSMPLRLLSGGPRDFPTRLQTMRGAIAWSYELLRPAEQALFRRLAVFVGGCAIEAAEMVCQLDGALEILEGLAALVDHSLLRSEEQPNGSVRLTMLETIRQYGLECLAASGEEAAIRRSHAAYYLKLAEKAATELLGPCQTIAVAWFDDERNNLRAALVWALECDDVEMGLSLAGMLWDFWAISGALSEGRGWLEAFLARDRACGEYRASIPVRARALHGAGLLAWHQGDLPAAARQAAESVALYREINDRASLSRALNTLGLAVLYQGAVERASALYEESLALARDLGERGLIALALSNLAEICTLRADYDRAADLWGESLTLFREMRMPSVIAYALYGLGEAQYYQGNYAQSAAMLRECLALYVKLDFHLHASDALDVLALMAWDLGRMEQAVRLFGAGAASREAVGATHSPNKRAHTDRTLAEAHAALGDNGFAAAWKAGAAMGLEEAVAYALETALAE